MVFKKILVALDHTIQSDEVMMHALDLAQTENGNLMLIHVLHPEPEPSTNYFIGVGAFAELNLYQQATQIRQTQLQKRIEDVENWLKAYAQDAAARGILAEYIHVVGNPEVEICQIAQQWRADLIILGRRGRQGLTEFVLGSVSNYVMHHAPCSALVVQADAVVSEDRQTTRSVVR
ncbi:MAG: universal stress protein [Leptolyngbyaceae cyanobacterium MO_188.B28]|nr:universal stress protein [Leptolyngbyaceae cyanobacterium MO_188.B28]